MATGQHEGRISHVNAGNQSDAVMEGTVTAYILIREDQSELGYIDTSVGGVFADKAAAEASERIERLRARDKGLVVEDDDTDGDWQVSWKIEGHDVADGTARLVHAGSSAD
jgi:hypothetical protein